MGRKDIPLGVKIISGWYYIIPGSLGISFGILLSFFGGFGGIVGVLMGVGFTVTGVLALFLGRDLLATKSWARITIIILSFIGVILEFFVSKWNFISSVGILKVLVNVLFGVFGTDIGFSYYFAYFLHIFIIILNLLIAGYLLFNKRVKEAFSKS